MEEWFKSTQRLRGGDRFTFIQSVIGIWKRFQLREVEQCDGCLINVLRCNERTQVSFLLFELGILEEMTTLGEDTYKMWM